MRYIKGFVSCLLAIVIVSLNAFAVGQDKAAVESASITEYQMLMSSFEDQKLNNQISADYPDYYAGAYIDDDGELVVLVTDTSAATANKISGITQNTDIDVAYAPVSYNELEAYQHLIANAMMNIIETVNNTGSSRVDSDMVALGESFIGVGIDEINNKVFVDLTDISDENIAAFRKYITDYENVAFELDMEYDNSEREQIRAHSQSQTLEVNGANAITLKAGYKINVDSQAASIGYRCNLNGMNGFVTAGHCIPANYEVDKAYICYNGVEIGETKARRYQAGTVDAAFVQVYDGVSVSNLTAGGPAMSNYFLTSMPTGMTVYMYGGVTDATLTGEILGTNYICASDNGFLLTDQLKIEYNRVTAGGDSGGIVYTFLDNHYSIVGLHRGTRYKESNSNYNDPTKNWGIATKACNIYNVMGCVPY